MEILISIIEGIPHLKLWGWTYLVWGGIVAYICIGIFVVQRDFDGQIILDDLKKHPIITSFSYVCLVILWPILFLK